jgi:hypothetical protein
MLTEPVMRDRVPNSLCDYQTSQLVNEVDRRAHYNLVISVTGEPGDKNLIDVHIGCGTAGAIILVGYPDVY